MFVSNAREAEPFVAPDLSEIRVLVDRATVGVASVSLAHATVAAGAETYGTDCKPPMRSILFSRGAGWFRSETNLARSGPAMRSGYRLVSRRKSGP